MKTQAKGSIPTGKRAAVSLLYMASALIVIMGIALIVLSRLHDVRIAVMQSDIPGEAFGAVIVLLGVRYFLAVGRLRKEVFKPSSRFSWNNFKGR